MRRISLLTRESGLLHRRQYRPGILCRTWQLVGRHPVLGYPKGDFFTGLQVTEIRILAIDLDRLVCARLEAERRQRVAPHVQQLDGREVGVGEIHLVIELRIALAIVITRFEARGRCIRALREELRAELQRRALNFRKLGRVDGIGANSANRQRQGER